MIDNDVDVIVRLRYGPIQKGWGMAYPEMSPQFWI